MRGEDYRPAAFCYLTEEFHDLFFRRRIETRGRFVQKDHRGLGHQFDCDRNPLSLAAGKLGHRNVATFRESGHIHHFIHDLIDLSARHIARQTEPRHIIERAIDGQLTMNDVVLRHVADRLLQRIQMAIKIEIVDEHKAAARRTHAVERIHQR